MTRNIIEIKDFSWRYESRDDFALKNITLDIPEGSFYTIIGPNESGKSTLLYAIRGVVPEVFRGELKGEIRILGKTLEEWTSRELAKCVGLVFSDPELQFVTMNVEDEIAFGLENLGFSLEEMEERIKWATKITEIGHLLDKSPLSISGGQKQRVALAAILALKPKVLLLDEPTTMLDPLGKEAMFSILEYMKKNEDMTIILATHEIERVIDITDKFVLIYNGELKFVCTPEELVDKLEYLEEIGLTHLDLLKVFKMVGEIGLWNEKIPINFEEIKVALKDILKC